MGEESEDDYAHFEPPAKAIRIGSPDDFLSMILSEVREIRTCMTTRLTSLEIKVSLLAQNCCKIGSKLDSLEMLISKSTEEKADCGSDFHKAEVLLAHDIKKQGSVQVVPLTTEADFPSGSWLGDPKNSSKRVRSPISPQNLLHIDSTCVTPEKMALTLLDYLFTREELATSNLSGRSRWKKKQLDPLMIYGVRCHLQHKFNISEQDWIKICQNMDSKCRTAWKRYKMGNPNKKSGAKIITCPEPGGKDSGISEDMNFDFDQLQNSNIDLSNVKVITQSPCELQILRATPEQMSRLEGGEEIILSGEQILSDSSDEKSILLGNSACVSMDTVAITSEELANELTIQVTTSPNLKGRSGQVPVQAAQVHALSHITLKEGLKAEDEDSNSLDIEEESIEDNLQLEVSQERE